jgi:hypothetical protein
VEEEEYKRRVKLLRDNMRAKSITYNWHEADVSLVEAALSRGDRRVGDAIEAVWRAGGKLDSWSEYFSFDRWNDAFASVGLSMSFYANRTRAEDELLPWEVIDVGVNKSYLLKEKHTAYEGNLTPDCRVKCTGCGANCLLERRKCDE